jgi:ectoine hydroxylase-related dioxygenase (phytanoyl-CoA dioxygenase family)
MIARLVRDVYWDERVQWVLGSFHTRPVIEHTKVLIKAAGAPETPWHQDHAYFNLPEGTPVVGVWIALDDATPENGCMHFIPGGHREGPIAHFNRRDWQICDEEILN